MRCDGQVDVAIVGASIAGCTAATLFARHGLKVVLIERDADPVGYKRICTHFIQPSATPTLARLGIIDAIERADGRRNGIEIWTPFGWIKPPVYQHARKPVYGYNIQREKLDPILRTLATTSPGVEYLPGHSAYRLITEGERFIGVSVQDRTGGRRDIYARLTVAADGRHSRLAKLSGAKTSVKPNHRFVYYAYFRDTPLTSGDNSQFWFLGKDSGFAYPCNDGLTLLCCFIQQNKFPVWKQDVENNFLHFLRDLPDAPDIRPENRVSDMRGMLKLENTFRQAAVPGLAFIGDAAMAADPMSGVGCGWALQSAEWLVDSTAEELQGGNLLRGLRSYRDKHRRTLRWHEYFISDASKARDLNLLERLIFTAASKDPMIADHLAAFIARTISVGEFLSPKTLVRIVAGRLRSTIPA